MDSIKSHENVIFIG